MEIEKLKSKNVCIELKNGSKYFGVISEVDTSPSEFNWIILNIRGNESYFSDTEIARVEVLR